MILSFSILDHHQIAFLIFCFMTNYIILSAAAVFSSTLFIICALIQTD